MKPTTPPYRKTDPEHPDDKASRDTFYEKEELSTCPQDGSEVIHKITLKKATCTRVPDTVLHFVCSRDSGCQECAEEYP